MGRVRRAGKGGLLWVYVWCIRASNTDCRLVSRCRDSLWHCCSRNFFSFFFSWEANAVRKIESVTPVFITHTHTTRIKTCTHTCSQENGRLHTEKLSAFLLSLILLTVLRTWKKDTKNGSKRDNCSARWIKTKYLPQQNTCEYAKCKNGEGRIKCGMEGTYFEG